MNIKMGNGSSILMSDKGESVKSIFQKDNNVVTKQAADIKMADVFGEGFSLWNESGFINDGESDLGSMSCNSFTDAAVIAINSYDANQALIAKQAEQIKMHKNQIAKIIMLHKQSSLGGDSSVDALFELDGFIESLEATKE